jgi:hypothetical protein
LFFFFFYFFLNVATQGVKRRGTGWDLVLGGQLGAGVGTEGVAVLQERQQTIGSMMNHTTLIPPPLKQTN